jgi:CRP-like cAMP-binding protein
VHFVWDSLVFLGIGSLVVKLGPHNKWLVVALVAASLHEVEHLFLFYLDRFESDFYNAGGTTGIMARGGLIGSPFERPYLHYLYNFLVVVPVCLAFWDETKRAYNVYLARALPSLSHQERVSASTELERVRVPAGQDVFRQGEEADSFYIIVKGEVDVIRERDDGGHIVDRMGQGHFFGEMGILTGQPRTATIRVVSDVELMALDADEFMALVARSKGAAADVESELHERLLNLREKGHELDHLHGAMAGTRKGGRPVIRASSRSGNGGTAGAAPVDE